MKTFEIYPSLINANLLMLREEIVELEPFVDGFHIDVMDFHFVPNLTWGPAFIKAIARQTDRPLHIHLMVNDPIKWVEVLSLRKQDLFVFHFEAVIEQKKIKQLTDLVRQKGAGVGIAMSPKTPPSMVYEYLPLIDQILVMSVEPGFSGQAFIPDAQEKVSLLAEHITRQQLPCKICLDGGIGPNNIPDLVARGARQFAMASAIFDDAEPLEVIKNIRSLGR